MERHVNMHEREEKYVGECGMERQRHVREALKEAVTSQWVP
jgi:hypothetical protein